MDKILKKFGMSDALYQLKNGTAGDNNHSSLKKSSKTQFLNNSIQTQSKKSKICPCKQSSYQKSQALNNSSKYFQQQNMKSNSKNKFISFTVQQNNKSNKTILNKSKQKSFNNSLVSKQSNKKSHGKKLQNLPQQPNITSFNAQEQSQKQFEQTRNLQQIILLLKKKLNCKCLIPKHQQNKILYVCLQENCQNRIGCSYCFLHEHQKHLKAQINTCINDLQQLIFKIKANQKLYSKKILVYYSDFNQKLQTQIKNIKQEFQSNLQFLKMKVKAEFQSYFHSKYSNYLQNQQNLINFQTKYTNRASQQQKNFDFQKTLKFDQIKKLSKTIQKQKQLSEQQKQRGILSHLALLNIQNIYIYLRNRLQLLHFDAAQSKFFLQFFQEMNSSVTHLFSAFKRNIPKIFVQESKSIEKPEILMRKT